MEWAQTLTLLAATPLSTGTSALQWFMIIIGIGAGLGGLAAGFYGARQKGIIELLKTENTAYKESNARLHEENNTLKQTCAQATAEAKIWRDNVTQRPSIQKMIETNQRQHKEYMGEMAKVAKGLSDLVTQQGKLTEVIAQTIVKEGSNG